MKARGGASERVSFENPGVRDVLLRGGDALPFAGRIAQSVEHSANNAAVQGSSPCMTILTLLLHSVVQLRRCF